MHGREGGIMEIMVCSAPIYEYEGWLFEWRRYMTPHPLTKELEPRKRVGDKFWDMFDRFCALPDDEQKKYRIGGGCKRL